jgi:hypothetical protein
MHDLDTNRRLLACSVENAETDEFNRACSPVLPDRVLLPRWTPPRWWPADLRQGLRAAGLYRFYSCGTTSRPSSPVRATYAAVDDRAKSLFVWDVPD